MTRDSIREGLVELATTEEAVKFLADAAVYFENRATGGEDRAHWANVYNAENCRMVADLLRRYHQALCSIVSWHADARDVFPDWKTTAEALSDIAEKALAGQDWLEEPSRAKAQS